MNAAVLTRAERYRATRFTALVTATSNALLAAAQVVAGWLFQSQALLADGVHTLSDLASDAVVLFSARKAAAEPDDEHPYGHGRIETVATVVVGVMLGLAGLGIAWSAVGRLIEWQTLTPPGAPALAFAVLALVTKEGLYQYTMRVARRIDSRLLQANAWHHRSDALSSLVVLVGIGGALAGWPWLDSAAALGVAVLIMLMAWRLIARSTAELVDAALEPEQVAAIESVVQAVPGVKSIHMLRTRRLGSLSAADLHIQVAPMISVSEGHQIADEVFLAVRNRLPELRDVTVHVDSEDDETQPRCMGLPMRPEITRMLHEAWAGQPELASLDRIGLDYLNGRVHLTVTLPLPANQSGAGMQQRAGELAALLHESEVLAPILGDVVVLFRAPT